MGSKLTLFPLVALRLLDRLLGVPLAAQTAVGKGKGHEQAAPRAPKGRPLDALWRLSSTLGLHLGASWATSWQTFWSPGLRKGWWGAARRA